jgi:hypothetical protein
MSDQVTMAVAVFTARLAELRGHYDSQLDKSDVRTQRKYAQDALAVVDLLCSDLGFGAKVTAPLTRLIIGLENVESGKSDDLFNPVRDSNAGIHSVAWNYRGRIAAAQGFVMKTAGGPYTQQEAAQFVVNTIGEANIDKLKEKNSRPASRVKTVSRWRADRKSSPLTFQSGYQAMTALLELQTSKDPAARTGIVRQRLLRLREFIEDPMTLSEGDPN